MSGPDQKGVPLGIDDPYMKDLSAVEYEQAYTINLDYTEQAQNSEYGSIKKRGFDLSLEYPVEDIEELRHQRHLTVQVAEANQRSPMEPVLLTPTANQVATKFDYSVLEVADRALAAEGVSLADLSELTNHVKALIIHDAWDMESKPELARHLDNKSAITPELGYESAPDQSTFAKASNELEDAGVLESIKTAALRAVHAVFRSGIQIPQQVQEAYGLNFQLDINEAEIPSGTKRAALCNWIDEVLIDLIELIDFDRGENTSHEIPRFVGFLAQAALINGVNSAKSSAEWHYKDTELPTGGHVSEVIRDLTQHDLIAMFTRVNEEFIKMLVDMGFFQSPVSCGLDTTWVSWDSDGDRDNAEWKLIDNPKTCDTNTGWCFAGVTVTELDSRFCLGIDLVSDKSNTVGRFRNLLRTAGNRGNLGRIHADREFASSDAVEMCRDIAVRNWGIRAKKTGDAKKLLQQTQKGESNFSDDISFASMTRPPNLYIHPRPEEHWKDGGMPHLPLFTDCHPESDDLTDLYETYMKRWSIEVFFRQIKHEFYPATKSPSPTLRLFNFQIASVFFNIHTLVNRARSPKYGLRLDVPYYEVLQAITSVIFTRASATEV